MPSVNWNTFPSSGEKPSKSASETELSSWKVKKRFGKLRINDGTTAKQLPDDAPAPPRPPKPAHMVLENPGHNYLNLDGATESSKPVTPVTPVPVTIPTNTTVITDETYDFPRSHQPGTIDTGSLARRNRHCYTNAAPASASTIANDERIFRYDFHDDEPPSSRSEFTATYTNLPNTPAASGSQLHLASATTSPSSTTTSTTTTMAASTAPPPPPVVYRQLKPGRKTSDTLSIISNEPSPVLLGASSTTLEISSAEPSPAEPPSINRKLKPPLNRTSYEMTGKCCIEFYQKVYITYFTL